MLQVSAIVTLGNEMVKKNLGRRRPRLGKGKQKVRNKKKKTPGDGEREKEKNRHQKKGKEEKTQRNVLARSLVNVSASVNSLSHSWSSLYCGH